MSSSFFKCWPEALFDYHAHLHRQSFARCAVANKTYRRRHFRLTRDGAVEDDEREGEA